MSRLEAELQRLYLCADAPAGEVRALVLEVARPADWEVLGKVWQGVQADLDLPAPAIAVSGVDAYQLWFSLREPVSAAQARGFLDAVRRRYLPEVPADRVGMNPPDAPMPPTQTATGRWSAFVTQDLAGLFADEPWLDLPPGLDAQADLLSRLHSIKPADWARALQRLQPAVADTRASTSPAPSADEQPDPKRFLLGIMNDRAIELHLRIEAAKALLPYFEEPRSP
jgi:hypothetical protein